MKTTSETDPLVRVEPKGHGYGDTDRRRGGVVQKITSERTGRTAEIRLRKSDLEFSCAIGEDVGYSKDGAALEKWARELLDKNELVDWLPVIQIEVKTGYYAKQYAKARRETKPALLDEIKSEIEFEAKRYWIGRSNAGRWRKLDWQYGVPGHRDYVEPERRLPRATEWSAAEMDESGHTLPIGKSATLSLPFSRRWNRGDNRKDYLEYDEALWNALLRFADVLANSRATLETLTRTPEGLESLRLVGSTGAPLLLSSGTPTLTVEPLDPDDEYDEDEP